MNYALPQGHLKTHDDTSLPTLSEVNIIRELKKVGAYFLDTLSLGQDAFLMNKIYQEYIHLLDENRKIKESIGILDEKISFLKDIIEFVGCLGLEDSIPDVSGDPDTDISLEWTNSNDEELILTFVGESKIIYSGVLDDGTVSGVAFFKKKEIPKNIRALVQYFDSES